MKLWKYCLYIVLLSKFNYNENKDLMKVTTKKYIEINHGITVIFNKTNKSLYFRRFYWVYKKIYGTNCLKAWQINGTKPSIYGTKSKIYGTKWLAPVQQG